MDIRSGCDVLTNNEIGCNKRKRKSTSDDKNYENHPPYKRMYVLHKENTPSAAIDASIDGGKALPASQQQQLQPSSSSDEHISASSSDFELLSSIGSPPSVVSSGHILSPIAEVSPKKNSLRGDSTPHSHKKHFLGCCSNSTATSTSSTSASNTSTSTVTTNTVSIQQNVSCCAVTPSSELRLCPLPALAWAEAADVWRFMCRKDEKASLDRDSQMLSNHPGIQPRMRAILLDWLIEVCEVYKLHRETYYLAVDYLDRFLSTNAKISKTRLQLIGITCLFVAAKVEEIYPPKIGEFAYVTDGACLEEDIIQQELILLSALNWSISPVTVIGWLSVYMQLQTTNRTPKSLNRLVNSRTAASGSGGGDETDGDEDCREGGAFVYPQFSGLEFARAAQIIDLCTLDLGLANFPYSVIAAAALCFTCGKSTALRVSGLDWSIVGPCATWMAPFHEVIADDSSQIFLLEQNEQVKSALGLNHICPNINTDDSHIIQTHSTSLNLFDRAMVLREKRDEAMIAVAKQEASPAQTTMAAEHSCPEGLLTPPASNRKFINGGGGGSSSNSESDITTEILNAHTITKKTY